MAKGNPNPKAGFKNNPERARLAGQKSRKTTRDIMDARKLRAVQFEEIVYKYFDFTLVDLNARMNDVNTPAVELVVIRLLVKSIQLGDPSRINFLLDRTIGKVKEKLQIEDNRSSHKSIVDALQADQNVIELNAAAVE